MFETMSVRRCGAVLCAGALVAALAVLPGGAADKDSPAGEHSAHSAAFDKCAKACNDCQRNCDACATHCATLVASGKKEHLKSLQTCRDCADFCSTAAQIVARQGPFADLICRSCAEACARCGKTCEQFSDDKMMKACADECKRCEKACREMLQHTGQGG